MLQKASNYFIIYAKCKKCKDLNYIIKCKDKPTTDNVILTVEKSNEHVMDQHKDFKHTRRIEGDERFSLAKEIKANHGGSAKSYFQIEIGKKS